MIILVHNRGAVQLILSLNFINHWEIWKISSVIILKQLITSENMSKLNHCKLLSLKRLRKNISLLITYIQIICTRIPILFSKNLKFVGLLTLDAEPAPISRSLILGTCVYMLNIDHQNRCALAPNSSPSPWARDLLS